MHTHTQGFTCFWCFGFCQLRPHVHASITHPKAPADGKPIARLPSTDSKPPSTIKENRIPFAYVYGYYGSRETKKKQNKQNREKKREEKYERFNG